MGFSQEDIDELVLQARIRAERIADMEERLEHDRLLRRSDAVFLVRNTDLTRSAIAELLGVSRVTLHLYLKDLGIDDQEAPKPDKDDGKLAKRRVIYRIGPQRKAPRD